MGESTHRQRGLGWAGLVAISLWGCGSSVSDGVPDGGSKQGFDAGALDANTCGDGTVQPHEACDEGAANSDAWAATPHCNGTCSGIAPYCGDGATDSGNEACDDAEGNSDDWAAGAHCNSSCTALAPHCGDGNADAGNETCDDAAANSDFWSVAAHCNASCTGTAPYCGDGSTEAGSEFCDDAGGNSALWSLVAHCNADCSALAPHCGDGNTDGPSELCDDGAQNSDAWAAVPHCNATCTQETPLCNLAESTPLGPIPGVPYPTGNSHSQGKAILGKVLFWEQQLSSDDTVACGSCHVPEAGGSDGRPTVAFHPGPDGVQETGDDVRGSAGIRRCQIQGGAVVRVPDATFGMNVQITGRKAPSAFDAMFASLLFWDGRAVGEFVDPSTGTVLWATGGALENQALGPLVSPVEMACEDRTLDDVVAKLEGAIPLALASDLPPDMANAVCRYPTYALLFENAFGDDSVTAARIAMAIATYERTLVSNQTPYDRFVDPENPDLNALTADQQAGLALFTSAADTNCNACHNVGATFANDDFHDLGFQDVASQSFPDLGRGEVTGLSADDGKFRTPTLRNVGLREEGGLFHGGDAYTLLDVMNAYNITLIPPGPGSNTDPAIEPLGLTAQEIAQIIDFMANALTDPRVENAEYPFDHPTLTEFD